MDEISCFLEYIYILRKKKEEEKNDEEQWWIGLKKCF